MTKNNMPAWVTSNRTAFYLTLSAIVVLFPNFFYMMYKIGGDMPIPGLRLLQALLAGLYVSGSIAYFTLKGKIKVAYAFAIFEMFISFFYYWNRLMFDDAGSWHMNFYIIPACLIAMFLPWSVKNYAACVSADPEPALKEVDYNELNEVEKKELIQTISKREYPLTHAPQRAYTRHVEDVKIIDNLNFEKEKYRIEAANLLEKVKKLEAESKLREYPVDHVTMDSDIIYYVPGEKEGERVIQHTTPEKLFERIKELEDIFKHNHQEIQKAVGLNIDLEKQIEALEKEKKWYKSIVEEYNMQKPARVSPIFKKAEHIGEYDIITDELQNKINEIKDKIALRDIGPIGIDYNPTGSIIIDSLKDKTE